LDNFNIERSKLNQQISDHQNENAKLEMRVENIKKLLNDHDQKNGNQNKALTWDLD
jgi:cell division protein FtsB